MAAVLRIIVGGGGQGLRQGDWLGGYCSIANHMEVVSFWFLGFANEWGVGCKTEE